jgi:hypothetical protein
VIAPVPAPRLSPTAGVFNAIVRHLNTRPTARDFADTDNAGYIDRTGIEGS